MKRMMGFIIILSLFAMLGCSFKMVYPPMTKEGIDQMQAKKDSYECKKEAADYRSKMAVGGGGSGGAMRNGTGVIGPGPGLRVTRAAIEQASEFYVECMELRGYRKSDEP